MIKGRDKITHFYNSGNDFYDNVIISDNVITKMLSLLSLVIMLSY
jgi:hypothetical protein